MTPTTAAITPDVDAIRRRFPALAGPTAYLENAGGSQVPDVVIEAIRRYMSESFVQLEAGYAVSDRSDAVVEGAHDFAELLVGGRGTGRAIIGPSSTQLVSMLAAAYGATIEPGDEIIVCESGHETNVGPWARLEAIGATVRVWKVDPATGRLPLEGLVGLLSPRTRVVALLHVSNLLGDINDVAAATRLAHEHGGTAARPARVVVDGVAFAPHRAVDVAALGVDWYFFSTYKVYGPHQAILWGSHEAIDEVPRPNHFFIDRSAVPYSFELGGVSHEACAGILGVAPYLRFLAGERSPSDELESARTLERDTVERAFEVMTAHELPLQARLLTYLDARPDVRIVGPREDGSSRVGTISFVTDRASSRDVAARAHRADIGIRNGHMYAHRLCTALGIEPDDGVVRVSVLHYNTQRDLDRLIEVLDAI